MSDICQSHRLYGVGTPLFPVELVSLKFFLELKINIFYFILFSFDFKRYFHLFLGEIFIFYRDES